MERDDFYIKLGEKLKKARKKVGMTQKEVAEHVGFENYQTLLSIEKGERPIQTWELLKIAKIYNYDINYFLYDSWDIYDTLKFAWRKAIDSPQLKIYERQFIDYCQRYFLLEKKIGLDKIISEFTPLDEKEKIGFNYNRAKELATKYWQDYKLGNRPALILSKILEEDLGIKILYLPLDDYGSGVATIGDFGPSILINSLEVPWRRNFDLAHEFFHLLTWNIFDPEKIHCSDNKDEKSIEDSYADCFASTLLLPKDAIIDELRKKAENNTLSDVESINIAQKFGVSIDALIWRLVSLGLLSSISAEEILENPELREKSKQLRSYEKGTEPKFSDRYISIAFSCYKKGYISRRKLAEYFDIELPELSDFLEDKGYFEEGDYEIEINTP